MDHFLIDSSYMRFLIGFIYMNVEWYEFRWVKKDVERRLKSFVTIALQSKRNR